MKLFRLIIPCLHLLVTWLLRPFAALVQAVVTPRGVLLPRLTIPLPKTQTAIRSGVTALLLAMLTSTSWVGMKVNLSAPVPVVLVQAEAQAQFVSDTLSDTAGVNLTAHTGATGATWTKVTGNTGDLIFGTSPAGVRAGSNAVATAYIASGTPTSADYDVQATLNIQAGSYADLIARMSTSAYTGYIAGITPASGYVIYRYDAGTPTLLISTGTPPTSGTHTYKLSVRGTGATVTLSLYDNAALVASASDTSASRITTAGKSGIQVYSTVAPTDGNTAHFTNFTATDASAATLYTASIGGVTTGAVNSPITITLTGNGTTTATVTPAVSGITGTFSPTTRALNGLTPVTLTFTPTSAGTATLSFTNDGGLSNPSSLTYTAYVVTSQIVFKGDSLTYSFGATGAGGITGTTYPADVLSYLGPTWTGVNRGVSGQTLATMITNFATDVTSQYSSSYTTHILCLEGGTNDIGSTTDSAATVYGRIVTLAGMGRTAGFKVIVCSIPNCYYGGPGLTSGTYPRQGNTGLFGPVAAAVNVLLRANWRSFADGFADYAADQRFSDYTNTTYFAADQVHYTDLGYAVGEASYFTAAIQQVISGGTTPGTTGFKRILR